MLRSKISSVGKDKQQLSKETEKLSKKQTMPPNQEDFKNLCDIFLTKKISSFVKVQLNLINRSAQGRRYSDEFKKFAISLYFLGSKCYRQLQKTFCLPSPKALQRFVAKIKFSTGLNEDLFAFLKLKVDKMSPEEKICILCMDEMSLK
ncbi:hypothetical protein ILUMI_12198 [Ignelater luminosus]|uniref:Transposase n=1 Tax=Ignelater luminosus TaxID=2038154 RepID=A0A8K0CUP6_IGNLU|nr:hypothetical protein ILUMI_12198 [Ignelater luminosus]